MTASLKLYSDNFKNKNDELTQIWVETASCIIEKEKKSWLPNIANIANLLRIEENTAVLSVPTEFHKGIAEKIENKEGVMKYLRLELPQITDISFEIVEDKDAKTEEEMLRQAEKEQILKQHKLQKQYNKPTKTKLTTPKFNICGEFYEEYTFDSFVVCDTNKKAHELCLYTAEMPLDSTNKILAIYGKSGVGKTHLLQAIGHYAHEGKTAKTIKYLCAIDFVADYVNFVKNRGHLTEFYEKFTGIDLFLIDDVHLFRNGQIATQKIFLDILTILYDSNKQIVITSDCPPAEIPEMIETLKTRLQNSIAVEILNPSKKNRAEIIKHKFSGDEIYLNEEVIAYIADIPTTNIRELEGLYNRLLAASVFCNADLDLNSVKLILNDYIKDSQRITSDIIIDRVCAYYAVSPTEIRSPSRVKNIVYARSIAMYLIRTIAGKSEQVIGSILERNHSTVSITCKNITEKIKNNKKVEADIETLTLIITGKDSN